MHGGTAQRTQEASSHERASGFANFMKLVISVRIRSMAPAALTSPPEIGNSCPCRDPCAQPQEGAVPSPKRTCYPILLICPRDASAPAVDPGSVSDSSIFPIRW